MKIGVLGTGMVGRTIGTKLVQLGHDVRMGSRTADNPKALEWVRSTGGGTTCGTFADAAAHGEIVFNCTSGSGAILALNMCGAANLNGKILIDVTNPLEFAEGASPSLSICNTDSLGEKIQKTFPDLRVVKTLNSVNCRVMVEPSLIKSDHDMFISGNDIEAKKKVIEILKDWFGWKSIIDLGDISGARSQEMMLPMWLRLMGIYGSPDFNFRVVR